ncbi:MAG: metallophosphoesterase, partial [Pseudomonadota bacterium]
MRRLPFFLIATVVIYLVLCLPLGILICWLTDGAISTALLTGLVAALPVALTMWVAVQSPNLFIKWPLLQLIGLTTILLSVLAVAAPLHLILDAQMVGITALLLWITAAVYAAYAAQSIKNIPLTISSPKLHRSHRLVHLSDLHAGSRSPRFIEKCVAQAQSHDPDFVVITGDLLDSSAVDKAFLNSLARFDCPVWMSLGNHERYVDLQDAIAAIEHHGVNVLRDTHVDFNQLQIIGVDDTDNPTHAAQQLAT